MRLETYRAGKERGDTGTYLSREYYGVKSGENSYSGVKNFEPKVSHFSFRTGFETFFSHKIILEVVPFNIWLLVILLDMLLPSDD